MYFRILFLGLAIVIMISIFVLIVWRGWVAFWFSFKNKTIFLLAIGLLLILMAGFFLSTSSSPPLEVVWLIFIWVIYLLWFISPLLIVRDIVSFFYTIPPMVMIGVSFLWLGFGLYYGTFHIQITPLTMVSNRLTNNYKIVFISDLHIEAIHNRQYVQTIVDRIERLQPDFVVIGGDLMNMSKPMYVDALLPFNQLEMPIYATLGNHDNMWDVTAVSDIAKKTHIILLRNQSVDIEELQLVGIDDKSYRWDKSLTTILQESNIVDNKAFTLLVSHQPQNLQKLTWYPIDLELAWHTHNGQFFPMSWIIRLFNDYAYGEYQFNGMTAFVSQGIGSWWAPFRLWTQREMVLISLQSSISWK